MTDDTFPITSASTTSAGSFAPETLPLGPMMIDVAEYRLSDTERERLRHPLVGGVILFARNFDSAEQLAALTAEIHALRDPPLIIAVDQEGGRVQRFRSDGFTCLPPMRRIGECWDEDRIRALDLARCTGFVLACELLAHGVDLSFTPVLDIDYGVSRAIGDRAFHPDPQTVTKLAGALVTGLAEAGMGCVGKHFPGHGFIEADSHVETPVDPRGFDDVWESDMLPYRQRLGRRLNGVMPAHVVFAGIDPRPAGFSPFWLQQTLRQRLQFDGVIFSDDLTMGAAETVGDIVARVEAAYGAGCDMVLICNHPDLADEALRRWSPEVTAHSRRRILGLRSQTGVMRHGDMFALELDPGYRQARDALHAFETDAV